MRNILIETRRILTGSAGTIKKGVIQGAKAGHGFIVQTTKGGQETVHGDGSIGDQIIYREGVIISRIEDENIKTFTIK